MKKNSIHHLESLFWLFGFLLFCLFTFHFFRPKYVKIDRDVRRDLENMLYMRLNGNDVIIQMYPHIAPEHVRRIRMLVRNKFYNNKPFHRVIPDFIMQCGEASELEKKKFKLKPLKAELSDISHAKGYVGMARKQDINSATSEFFILLGDSIFLDGQYTIWGKVLKGMDVLQDAASNYLKTKPKISDTNAYDFDEKLNEIVIEYIKVALDAEIEMARED